MYLLFIFARIDPAGYGWSELRSVLIANSSFPGVGRLKGREYEGQEIEARGATALNYFFESDSHRVSRHSMMTPELNRAFPRR